MPDGRLLYTEQNTGRVRVLLPGVGVQASPVLTVPQLNTGGERGLLGIALDPAYPARPYLYLHYTAKLPNHIRIARWKLSGDIGGGGELDLSADTLSRYDLIDDIPDQFDNHNGGTVRFGVDGYLYVSLGEDGQPCLAQDTTSLRGVVLRLKVDALPDGPGRAFRAQITPFNNPFVSRPDSNARLVAVLGLRNPFRIQPDRVRGWLVIGDVGESTREELDVMALRPPTPRPALPELGADFGWPFLEGTAFGPSRNACGPILSRSRGPRSSTTARASSAVRRSSRPAPIGPPAPGRSTGPRSTPATCSRTTTTRARCAGSWSRATATRSRRTCRDSRRRANGEWASRRSPIGL